MNIDNLQALFTASVNIAHNRSLFELLKLHCPVGSWLAAKDKNGTIWSLYKEDDKDAEHFLATTAFFDTQKPEKELPMNRAQISLLSKLDSKPLSIISNIMGLNMEGGSYALAACIASKVNAVARNKSNHSLSHQNPVASTSNTEDQGDHDPELENMTLKDLVIKAKEFGVKSAGKRKEKLLQDVIEAKKLKEDKVQIILNELSSSSNTTKAPHHSMYKSRFNGVDLHDKMWYKLQNHHSIYSWRAKFTLGIIQSGLINSYVVYKHLNEIHFLKYCEQLSDELCKRD